MADHLALERNQYRPSGVVRWSTFAPLAVAALAVSVGLAKLVAVLWIAVVSAAPVVFTAVAHMLAAAAAALAIGIGHCRNRLVAAALAIPMALVVIIGPYYFSLMALIGWKHAARLDLLPAYVIDGRIVDPDTGSPRYAPEREKRGTAADSIEGWILFGVEAPIALFVLPMIAMRRARRVYCERCGHWTRRTLSFFPSGTARLLAEALESGDWNSTRQLSPAAAVGVEQRQYTVAAVEWCPPTAAGKTVSEWSHRSIVATAKTGSCS